MKEELKFKLNLQNFAEGEDNPNPDEGKEEQPLSEVVKKLQAKLKNSVSKKDYDKVKEERDAAIGVIVEGQSMDYDDDEDDEDSSEAIDKRIKELGIHIGSSNNHDTNLQYVKNALELRDLVLKRDGVDIFATKVGTSNADKFSTVTDREEAEKVAQVFRECIEESDGDSGVFTAKLGSRMEDDPTVVAALKAREAAEKKRILMLKTKKGR